MLHDTYIAAIQHDLVDLDDDARLVGVVRRPLPWFSAQVDENRPVLGPPPALLDAFKDRLAELNTEDCPEPAAHNTAWDDTRFAERYREYLETSSEADTEILDIERLLAAGEEVVLVCFENTDEKRCHRTILKQYLESRRE